MGGPGSGGHNRRSAAQHRITGTFRADRHGSQTRAAPPRSGDVDPPQPPTGLSAPARQVWDRFVAAYRFADNLPALAGLELYCRAFDRHQQAREVIDRDGIMLTTPRGGRRAHPLLRIEHTAAMDMQRVLRNLRLDELAMPAAESDPFAEFDNPLERLQAQARLLRQRT